MGGHPPISRTSFPEADSLRIEMIHRYFAGSLGLLIFVVVAWCIKKNITSVGLPLLISATVIFQALLGMWTVTLKLMPVVVMAHPWAGSRYCHCSVLLYCRSSNVQHHFMSLFPILLKAWALFGLIVVVGQILLVDGHRLIMPLWCVPNYLFLVKVTG
ncbi:COX15/CtaA family protein [Vibrio lentus]|nr:COX15/CtaA family protein [Vibrio lentus]